MDTAEIQKQEKKNNRFTVRLMASYSILLLVILFMGIYLYFISIRNIQSGIREQNLTILQSSIEQLNTDLVSMSALARQIANDSQLVRLANLEDNDVAEFYLLAYETKNRLAMYLPSHMLLPIDSYFIRLRNTDYLLSFDHFEDLSHYYTRNRLLDSAKFDTWMELLNDSDSLYKLLPVAQFSGQYTRDQNNYFYLMSLEDFSFKDLPADICFELDMSKINQIFSELNLYDSGYICVADANGAPVFTIRPNQQPMEIDAAKEAIETFSRLSFDKEGFSSYRQSGNTMLVTTASSDHNQWIYYLVQPAQDAYYSTAPYQLVFLGCTCFALFFGFLLIILLSRRNSKPLIALDNELAQTKLKQQELLELARQQEPLLRTSYIRQIMKGTISTSEEMEYVRGYLNLGDEETHKFQVLYCSIYLDKYEVNTGGSNVVGIAVSDYDAIIKEAMARYLGGGEPLCLFSPHDRSYAVLITSERDADPEDVVKKITEDFAGLHNYLMEQHSISIFGGLGNRNGLLTFTWKSYQQAREALRYTSGERFICCYDDLNHNTHNYYYPDELAKQLSGFVEIGNKLQVEEIFKLIKKENLTRRSLSFNQMNWLLSDIRNTLLKVRFTIHEDDNNREALQTVDSHFEEMPSLRLYENIALVLCESIRIDTSENQLITRIKDYIYNNFRDPALCLSKISDEFSISESYFSYLFKKTTGENFSSYLEHLRMEQALHMIKDTSIKISDLYMELGYNNPTSFRRAFKKVYGVSPNAIRESNQAAPKESGGGDSE